MNGFWSKRRIAVTGGAGFLGSYVMEGLTGRGATHAVVADRNGYDLTQIEDVRRMYDDIAPDVVIHLAAVVGGIGANRLHPGSYFYDNLMMGVQLMDEGRKRNIEKFVAIGTICAYPNHTPVPFREEDLWNGYPEKTNAPYGLAKKMLLVQAQAYRAEYGFNAIYLLPVNLYGPRDNFDPDTSHVIPALIRKCLDAVDQGCDHITCWGTGRASREFLYAADAAEAILLATERYDRADPVNLGSGFEVTIAELATKIANLTGFRGEIRWDDSKPDGQPRRCLDTSRATASFGFSARMDFDEGLRHTIDWYRRQGDKVADRGTGCHQRSLCGT